MRYRLLASMFLLAAQPTITAQDMVAVSWGGEIYALNSYDGTTTLLGNGMVGQNALARDSQGVLWSTERTGSQYSLTTLDPTTASAISVWPTPDLRGLANAGNGQIYATDNSNNDALVVIDTNTGQITTVGSPIFTSIQALTAMDGVLYAWDINYGLLLMDPATGSATDVQPGFSTVGTGIQWLARRGDGRLVGGNDTLYEIDTVTGVTTLIGGIQNDLRGAVPWQQAITNFGTGCNQVTSTAIINAGPNPMLLTRSTNHEPNAIGIVILGISSTSTGGVPLPLSIDPIFGTVGCNLYVSLDLSLLAFTGATTPANLDLQIPIPNSWRGQSLMLQHAVLENVPGGVSLSDATVVQFRN